MITCPEFVKLLGDLVAGELPPERQADCRAHLGVCPPCVVLFESYQFTVRLGRGLSDAPLPVGMADRLVAVLRHARAAPPPPGPPS